MTLAEQLDRQIPEYYDTMYLDGYTPEQILAANRKKIRRILNERKAAAQAAEAKKWAEQPWKIKITSEVRVK